MRVVRIVVEHPRQTRRLDDYSASEWRAVIAGTLGGAIAEAQEAVFDLLAEGGGAILVSIPEVPRDAAARAAVAGLHGLVRSIAKEYGRKNIRCNMIVGPSFDIETMLADNPAITGELVAGSESVGAAGLD